MEKSTLIPFIRKNLDVLFIGLNPANGSSEKGHYFSVKNSFWKQLFESGLIMEEIDKSNADEIVFGSKKINFNNWNYGITDIVTEYAESNSKKIKPTINDCIRLEQQIRLFNPKTAILLHNKTLKYFLKHLGIQPLKTNTGYVGKILKGSNTIFFNIAFPHGNKISDEAKILRYKELKTLIQKLKK